MLRGSDKNPFASLFKRAKADPDRAAPQSGASSAPPAAAAPPPKNPSAATTATPSPAPPPTATGKQEHNDALKALDADLLTLLNMTGSTLLRAMRGAPTRRMSLPGRSSGTSQAAAAAAVTAALSGLENISGSGTRASDTGAFGPFPKGLELAGAIEQKARGLLLENSLTSEQSDYLSRITQSVQDLYIALRASRYAWQICLLLSPLEEGIGVCARLKRVTETLVGLNNQAAQALEGQDNAAMSAHAIAEQYRAFKIAVTQTETLLQNTPLTPVGHRLTGAALHCLSVCGDCMAKVGARFTLPVAEAVRHSSIPLKSSVMDHDPLLSPVPKR